jgi:hypothetical protein
MHEPTRKFRLRTSRSITQWDRHLKQLNQISRGLRVASKVGLIFVIPAEEFEASITVWLG